MEISICLCKLEGHSLWKNPNVSIKPVSDTCYREKLLITDITIDLYSSETFVQERQLLSSLHNQNQENVQGMGGGILSWGSDKRLEGNEASGIFWGPTERNHTERREAGPAPQTSVLSALCSAYKWPLSKSQTETLKERHFTVRGCLLL